MFASPHQSGKFRYNNTVSTTFNTLKAVFVCLLIIFSHTALAAPTLEINYQGKLTDTTGSAVSDGTYNIAFNLYTAGDTIVWSSTTTVPVQNGLFSYLLGSSTALTGVNFNQPLYLSVNIGGTGAPTWDGEMTPRKLLGTVPSAFEAQQLGGLATTSFLRADQADTANNLITFLGGVTTTDAIISGTATTTNLAIGGDLINELAGTGLTVIGNALTADLGTDIAASEIADGDHGVITYSSGVATFDNNVVTPDAILSTGQTDEYCLTYETGDSFEWQECAAGGSGGGGLQSIQVFDTAGTSTWTKPAGIDAVRVIVTGGGGGGGGAQDTTSEMAGGGGAGATAIEFVDVSATSTVFVRIGAGGAGGSGTNQGSLGATSSFSTFVEVTGGGGGGIVSGASGPGGAGGTVSVSGDINVAGGAGTPGTLDSGTPLWGNGGTGGASYWGGGGLGVSVGNSSGGNGEAGTAYGSGGGGAGDDTNTARSGGAGAPGIIVVYEYQTQGLATGTIETGTQGQLAFYENGGNTLTATSSLFLDTNGSFGIGTTSPLTTLDVWGNLRIGTTSNGYLSFGTTTGTSSYGIRNLAGTLQFKNNNGVWSAFGSGGASTLSDLSDVDTTGVAANDLLVYNGSSFVPTTLGTSSINATNYTDKYVLIASSTAPGGLAWVATSSLNITGGSSGSQYLTNHTFTSAETWTPLSGLSSAQTIPLWVDTTDMNSGYVHILVDDVVTETIGGGQASTRVLTPNSSLKLQSVANDFDISSKTFLHATSVAAQETSPYGLTFNASGTKMFVVGYIGDDVNEYTLSTAFDVSTASFVHATSVAAQEAQPYDVTFNTDGTKMFVIGAFGQDVNEYTLSTGFDVSTASFVDSFSVSAQETSPQGIAFHTDGTKMFILGSSGDDVNEYTLSTGFDVSTANFVDSFSVSAEITNPVDLSFNSDGTKMFITDSSADLVGEYTLSTSFDVSTASYVRDLNIGAGDQIPVATAFNEDGNKLYVIDAQDNTINEYALTNAFNLKAVNFKTNFSVNSQDTSPHSIAFSSTGTKMFVTGNTGDDVNEYTLSTGFDVSTASFVDSFSVSAQETSPNGIAFNTDGTKMFILGISGDDVNEYTLSTGFDVSTASFVDSFSVSAQAISAVGLGFNTLGNRMYVVDGYQNNVNEYTLSTGFDVSTASFVDSFSTNQQTTGPTGIAFNASGTKMYITGSSNVYEYQLGTAFDASTAVYVTAVDLTDQDSFLYGITFDTDGTKMFVIGATGDDVNEYTLTGSYSGTTYAAIGEVGGGGDSLLTDAGTNVHLTTVTDNFSIGTTSDNGVLTVAKNTTDTLLSLSQYGTGDLLNLFDGTTEVFSILDGGNVGIGTTSPAFALTVSGTIAPALNLTYDLGSSSNRFANLWAETLNVGTSTWSIFATSSGALTFSTQAEQAGTEALTILSNGNVGIGTTSPYAKFSVAGNVVATSFIATSTATSTFSTLQVTGGLYDTNGTAGTSGYVLQSTGSGVQWVATSSLGLGAGSGSIVVGDAKTAMFYDSSGGQTISSSSVTTINLNATSTNSAPNTYRLENNAVTVLEDGYYEVSYAITAERGSDTRGGYYGLIEIDKGGGFFEATSSRGYAYLRLPNEIVGTANGSVILSLSATDEVRLGGSSALIDADTIANYSSLSITKLEIGTGSSTSYWTQAASDIYYLSGNVGLSTTTPDYLLTVDGSAMFAGAIYDNSYSAGTNGYVLQTTGSGVQWVATSSLGISGGGGGSSLFTDGGATTYLTSLTDNLGIGTSTGAAKLTIAGTAGATGNLLALASSSDLSASTTDDFWFSVSDRGVTDIKGKVLDPTTAGNWDPNNTNVMNGAYSVTVAGNYAYVAGYDSSNLAIVDISDPANPVTVGNWDPNDSNVMTLAQSVTVAGNYAYVAGSGSDNLAIVDISDPANPVTVGNWDPNDTNVMNNATAVTVAGNYAYVAGGSSNNLAIVDIADPTNPTTVSNWDPNDLNVMNSAQSVTVAGHYAYVAGYHSQNIAIVDISDPANPTMVGNWDPNDTSVMYGTRSVAVAGNYAYATGDLSHNLAIVDIADPTNPVTVGNWDPNDTNVMNYARSVTVAGNYAYVAGVLSGNLAIVDISSSTNPTTVGNWDPNNTNVMSGAHSVTIAGNYAYVAGQNSDNLAIVDITGLTVSSLYAGSAEIDQLDVMQTANFNQNLVVRSGLNVGTNALVGGALTITGTPSSTLLSNNTNPALVVSSGYVGIGTTTPYQELSVTGDLALTGAIYDNSASAGTNGYVLQTTGSGVQWVATSSLGISGGGGGGSSLFTDSGATTYLTALTDNLSVGTTTSLGLFTAATSSSASILSLAQYGTGDLLNLFDGTTEVFTVLDGGNVGIGTANPTVELEVVGDIISAGTKWETQSAAGDDDSWEAVTYGNGLFVAVASSGGDRVVSSPDGINWSTTTAAGDNDGWYDVTYGNGLFVAVGNSGDRVMTSSDGINWTARSAAGDNDNWDSITYGNGLFVAVGSGGDYVMTSPDGITWTARSAAGDDDDWEAITYGNNLFVAVGRAGDRVITSSDGISWTARSATGDDDSWEAVTYGNGLFVAVGDSGDRVMTSSDGINWTARSAAGDNDSWFDVTYGAGLFVAVGDTGDRIITSPDGVNWTTRSAAGDNDGWLGITFGNGVFTAVSYGADVVMTSGTPNQTELAHNNIYQGGMSILSGNVGIGTTSPFSRLTVAGNITPDANLTYDLGSSTRRWSNLWAETLNVGTSTWSIFNGTDGRLAFSTQAEQAGTEALSILSIGNVGIGTTTPAHKLDIYGDARIDGDLYDAFGSAGTAGYVLQSTASGIQWVSTSSLNISGGGGGSQYLTSHTFTATSTWTALSGLSATQTIPVWIDTSDLTEGRIDVIVDDTVTEQVFPGQASTRVVAPASSLAIEAVAVGFDVSTASFIDSFSISGQDIFPSGLTFNPDGTKMFVAGIAGEDVNEYTLSTGFDVSTASFVDAFDISGQDTEPGGVAFNSDGTKMFVTGIDGADVNEYTLSTGFDVSTASFVDSFSVAGQETVPNDLAFNLDGTKMFVLGNDGDDVNEYTLSTGFDVSTASFVDSFSVAGQEAVPAGLAFSPDGTKMFVLGNDGVDVNEYTLSTGFDVSTASFVDSFSVSGQETLPAGLALNPDGTKMFVSGIAGEDVNEYTLDGTFSGSAYASIGEVGGGADLAELYPVSDTSIEAGDLVYFDTEDPIVVAKAIENNHKPLAGIISTQPGLTLSDGTKGVNNRPVALSGRVPTKVNLEGGPIFPGDRIAPSSVPGVGRKANQFEPSVGTAITPYTTEASTQGEITVFVDLQEGFNTTYLTDVLFNQASTTLTASSTATNTASSTNTILTVFTPTSPTDTIWTRLYSLAVNFVDGVLTIIGIDANRVATDELCVGDICVTQAEFESVFSGQMSETNNGTEAAVIVATPTTTTATETTENTSSSDESEDGAGEGGVADTTNEESVATTTKTDTTATSTTESSETQNPELTDEAESTATSSVETTTENQPSENEEAVDNSEELSSEPLPPAEALEETIEESSAETEGTHEEQVAEAEPEVDVSEAETETTQENNE